MVYALIIDDNKNNVEVLQRLLLAQNAKCTCLADPTQLETMWEKVRQADVVFLDLELPHIDGYEVFALLKENIDPAVPVVAYTVHTSEVDRARDMGFHSFLGKPLNPNLFPELLADILSGKSVWEY